jgi:outer membrane lipoprotein
MISVLGAEKRNPARRTNRMFREKAWLLSALAIFFLFGGCATTVPKEIVTKVTYYGEFAELQKSPEKFDGEFVILGGRIVEIANDPPFSNMIVLQFPLDANHQPRINDPSEGRFLVRSEPFLDPAVYSPGTVISVAGTVAGKEVRPVGGYSYVYPVIVPTRIWKWDLEKESYPRFHFGIGVGTFF